MKLWYAAILAGLVVLLVSLQSAQAAAVVAFSASSNAYGWCAGYAESRAQSCALQTCSSAGGTDCQIIVDCTGGWGAVAMSADSKIVGVGAACHGGNAYTARSEALANCIVASRSLCWTNSTFSPSGGAQAKDDNRAFDLNWYAQGALALLNDYDGSVDGDFGAASMHALETFQSDIGRTPDGVVNQEIVERLLDGVGGFTAFAPSIKKTFIDGQSETVTANAYGHAMSPSTAVTFGDELNADSADRQRLALATMLSVHNTKCSLPAQSAAVLPGSQNTAWNVTCDEGPYSLFISNDGSILTMPGLSSPGTASGANGPSGTASGVAAAAPAPEPQPASGQSPPDGMAPPMQAPAPTPAPPPQKVIVFVSGAGLQSACAETSPSNIGCVAYVQGVADTLVTMAALDGRTLAFCVPDGETGPQLAQIVEDYLVAHPELKETGGAGVIQQAFVEKLPCKAQ